MSDGGKGSKPCPISVDSGTFASNWDAIFAKKKPVPISELPELQELVREGLEDGTLTPE